MIFFYFSFPVRKRSIFFAPLFSHSESLFFQFKDITVDRLDSFSPLSPDLSSLSRRPVTSSISFLLSYAGSHKPIPFLPVGLFVSCIGIVKLPFSSRLLSAVLLHVSLFLRLVERRLRFPRVREMRSSGLAPTSVTPFFPAALSINGIFATCLLSFS